MSNPTLVVTHKVRFSYLNVFTPRASENGGEAKYSVTILLPKSDVDTKARIDAAINAAVTQGKEKHWQGYIPPNLKTPIHDGDGVRQDGSPFPPECKGHWVFTAGSKQPPEVVDAQLNPIINQSNIYSGCYGRVSIRFFSYATNGNKGIGCGLGNIQKLEDGEPLGGRTSASEDFAGFAQPAVNPSYGQLPPQPMVAPQTYTQPTTQPGYGQSFNQTQAQAVLDPITGLPIAPPAGGVMGVMGV